MFYSKELLIQPYAIDTIIGEWTTATTTTIDIKGDGIYEVIAVSGGGGGLYADGGVDTFTDTAYAYHYYTSGATGAYYDGKIRLNRGSYVITVGDGGAGGSGQQSGDGGQTSIGTTFILGGAQGSGQTNGSFTARGAGGSLTTYSTEVTRINYSAGYNQNYHGGGHDWYTEFGTQTGPSSSYSLGSYGYGGATKGAYYGSSGQKGGSGYLKIIYKGAY